MLDAFVLAIPLAPVTDTDKTNKKHVVKLYSQCWQENVIPLVDNSMKLSIHHL